MADVKGKSFVCVDCKQSYSREEDVFEHLLSECGRRWRLECPECSFCTLLEPAMESHYMRKHGFPGEFEEGAAFVCYGCGGGFSCSTDIEAHLRFDCPRTLEAKEMHTKNALVKGKPLKCPKCNGNFISLNCLQHHLKLACGKAPSESCPECSYQTFYRSTLEQHIRDSHGESSLLKIKGPVTDTFYKCSNCKQYIKYSSWFIDHLYFCAQEDILRCPQCPFITKFPGMLKNHFQRHAHTCLDKNDVKDEKEIVQFPCPQCEWNINSARLVQLLCTNRNFGVNEVYQNLIRAQNQ